LKILNDKSTSPKIANDMPNETRKWDLYFDYAIQTLFWSDIWEICVLVQRFYRFTLFDNNSSEICENSNNDPKILKI